MFINIPDVEIIAGITALAIFCFMSIVQWTKFVEHKKEHYEDTNEIIEKFAFLPYFVIPFGFVALATVFALVVGEYAYNEGYTVSGHSITALSVVVGVVAYGIADYIAIRRIGDSVFWLTVEKNFLERGKQVVETVAETVMDKTEQLAKGLEDLALQLRKQ